MELDDDGTIAGWHRDPSGRHELRFWNGTTWTEHIIDEGIPGLDSPTRSGRAPGAHATPTPTPPTHVAAAPDPSANEPDTTDDRDTDDEPVIDLVAAAEAETNVAEPEPAVVEIDEPLVATASVLTPIREAEGGAEGGSAIAAPPTGAHDSGSTHARPSGRSLRPRRRATPPVIPLAPTASAAPPASPPSPFEVQAPELSEVDDTPPVAAPTPEVDVTPLPTPPAPEVDVTPPPAPPEIPAPIAPADRVRVIAEPPTVASPAGNSAGSNTSAIADPHRAVSAHQPDAISVPRVAGVNPVPVKRYRPGSPPPSPFAGPRALPAPTGPVGTIVVPWYRKTSGWIAILVVGVVAAVSVVLIVTLTGNTESSRLGSRPPAAAPEGTKVIDGDGFGIAAPSGWIVATDPGNMFPELRRTNWGTPLAATDSANGEAIVVVALGNLRHNPQVDPDLFWSDQVSGAGTARSITAGPPLGVHGFRANEITATDPSGRALAAASIDTGDRTFLVAVTARTPEQAAQRFAALIQTFDAR